MRVSTWFRRSRAQCGSRLILLAFGSQNSSQLCTRSAVVWIEFQQASQLRLRFRQLLLLGIHVGQSGNRLRAFGIERCRSLVFAGCVVIPFLPLQQQCRRQVRLRIRGIQLCRLRVGG